MSDIKNITSNTLSILMHGVIIWMLIDFKNAHILTPSKSDGIEVSLVSPLNEPAVPPKIKINNTPQIKQTLKNAEINLKSPDKPKITHNKTLIASAPITQKQIKKPTPQHPDITKEILSQLRPINIGKSKNTYKGGTDKGTSNANVMLNNYADLVIEKVQPYIDIPDSINQSTIAIVKVTLLPNMRVYKVELSKSSYNQIYDDNVQMAIKKVGIFPPLPSGANFNDFKVLYLTFKP